MPNGPQQSHRPPLPLSYRQEIVPTIMRCIQAGDSCALIGAPQTGKTNLLRFLCRQDVQAKYLGSDAHRSLLVLVDANQAPDLSHWRNYIPFLEGLRGATKNLKDNIDSLAPYPADFGDTSRADSREGHRRLKDFLKELCETRDLKVVFLIDQFDRPFQELEDDFFITLRGFRDALEGDCKYKLCYVVTLCEAPGAIRLEFDTRCKPFHDLLAENVYGLKPYKSPDARLMIQRLVHPRGIAMPDEQHLQDFLWLAGGHGGLLRALFDVWRTGQWPITGDMVDELLTHPSVRGQCDKLWESLSREEKDMIGLIAREQDWPELDKDVVLYLRTKGLVNWPPGIPRANVFSPLFRVYAKHQLTLVPQLSRG